MDAKVSTSYRFGSYCVDVPAGQLRKNGTKLRLAGHPFEILAMLLERAGQVVTRDEIRQRLWPDETFGDFENSLNKAINKLRQVLADSAEQPIYCGGRILNPGDSCKPANPAREVRKRWRDR